MKNLFHQLRLKFTICELVLILCVFTLIVQNPFPPYKNYSKDKNCIFSDGFGYYSYLPAIFIYHDLNYSFFDNAYKKDYHSDPPVWVKSFIIKTDKGIVNKYWIGESLLLLPFFLIAHWLSLLLGFDADGYSILYQYAVSCASFFYLYLGCRFIYKFLLNKGFGIKVISASVFIIVFGTNLFYYSVYEPSMSHVYSFFCISGFCFFSFKYFSAPAFRSFFLASLFIMFIILLRPVNIITLAFVPFLAGNKTSFLNGFKKLFGFGFKLFIPLLLLCLFLLQTYLWHKQSGKWFIWSYPGESFNFSAPHFFDILFSYHKGFFVYMPVCFVALVGLITVFKQNKYMFFSLVLSLLLIIYILSSWYAWHYSACLGNRAFIDFYFIFCFLIASSSRFIQNKVIRVFLFLLYGILIFYNHIQIYQYRHLIYNNLQMNKEDFWRVFLQTGKGYEGILFDWSDNTDQLRLREMRKNLFLSSFCNFEKSDSLWSNHNIQAQKFYLSPPNVSAINDASVFGDAFKIDYQQLKVKTNIVTEAVLNVYLYNEFSSGYLIHQIKNAGNTVYWTQNKISTKNAGIGKWTELKFYAELPVLNQGDELLIFIMNSGNSSLYMDNCQVNLYSH